MTYAQTRCGGGEAEALVSCRGVSKAFGSVQALVDIDFAIGTGEVIALVGENGAGKTTLMRVLAGELAADKGTVEINTTVALVRQELSIIEGLSVLENVVFGSEPCKRGGIIEWRKARRRVTELMDNTGLTVPLDAPAAAIPPALQQRVELLRAIHRDAQILLLDEPTTYLNPREVDNLFAVIRQLTSEQLSAVFISHKLREVVDHCDRVTVLRKGRTAGDFSDRPFSLGAVGQAMTGDDGPGPFDGTSGRRRAIRTSQGGEVVLEAANGQLTIAAREIVGVAGVADNGQDELVATIVGLGRHPAYEPVTIAGGDVSGRNVQARRRSGLRAIPSNVRVAGCAISETLVANVLTAEVPEVVKGRFGTLRRDRAEELTAQVVETSEVVTVAADQSAWELSGGNLQRLVVGRELTCGGVILIAHEPTRGVDFRAAETIRQRIRQFADDGGAVLWVSSDLDELLLMCNPVHVMYAGRLSPAHDPQELSLGQLGRLMGGLKS